MLVKMKPGNEVVLPRQAVDALGGSTDLEVVVEDGRVVLSPARLDAGEAAWRKLESLGLTDQDVADAVAWARRTS